MKRITILFLCMFMVISVSACGKSESASSSEVAPVAGEATDGIVAGAAGSLGVTDRKASYQVVLVEVGPARLRIVKEVHEILGGNLKLARDLVEDAYRSPQVVKGFDTMEEAQNVCLILEDNGAKVEIREVYK